MLAALAGVVHDCQRAYLAVIDIDQIADATG